MNHSGNFIPLPLPQGQNVGISPELLKQAKDDAHLQALLMSMLAPPSHEAGAFLDQGHLPDYKTRSFIHDGKPYTAVCLLAEDHDKRDRGVWTGDGPGSIELAEDHDVRDRGVRIRIVNQKDLFEHYTLSDPTVWPEPFLENQPILLSQPGGMQNAPEFTLPCQLVENAFPSCTKKQRATLLSLCNQLHTKQNAPFTLISNRTAGGQPEDLSQIGLPFASGREESYFAIFGLILPHPEARKMSVTRIQIHDPDSAPLVDISQPKRSSTAEMFGRRFSPAAPSSVFGANQGAVPHLPGQTPTATQHLSNPASSPAFIEDAEMAGITASPELPGDASETSTETAVRLLEEAHRLSLGGRNPVTKEPGLTNRKAMAEALIELVTEKDLSVQNLVASSKARLHNFEYPQEIEDDLRTILDRESRLSAYNHIAHFNQIIAALSGLLPPSAPLPQNNDLQPASGG